MSFSFIDTLPLIDRELELVAPSGRWVDSMLQAAAHPLCHGDECADTMTRQSLLDFLRQAPHGRHEAGRHDRRADDSSSNSRGGGRVPAYTFWMRIRPDFLNPDLPPVAIAGSISLRIGQNHDLEMYYGHIGYNVFPAARGRHYAERSCRLLAPLARAHGMQRIWITCNPDNHASRRTCERLGAVLVDIVDVPPEIPLHSRGEICKCRYRWSLDEKR